MFYLIEYDTIDEAIEWAKKSRRPGRGSPADLAEVTGSAWRAPAPCLRPQRSAGSHHRDGGDCFRARFAGQA